MDMQLREQGSFTVVSPHQRLDTTTAVEAQEELSGLVGRGVRRIVVDFSDVSFVGSAGLRVLLATAKQLRAVGGDLRVCSLNETVQEVFEISGFTDLFPVFVSAQEAAVDS
jgi:anti-sigma B factor antagonist